MRLHYRFIPRLFSVLTVSILAAASTPQAADHLVSMTASWTFSPASIEIEVGDTVMWLNRDDFDDHDATSTDPNAMWSTGLVAPDESVTLQFLAAGTYPYRDSIYGSIGMTGTIVVKGGSTVTPAVELTNAARLPDGAFRFTLTNLAPGLETVIEFSTNLVNWNGLETNFPASDSLEFTNVAAGLFPQSFYRCYQVQ
jgi:plastocyanin